MTAVIDRIIEAYTGADRHYHDIRHIAAMLQLLDEHAPPAMDKLPLRWAVLYHDAVYNARAKDNEAASAALMTKDLAALGIGEPLRRHVAKLILATQHGSGWRNTDEATALLIDIDLAVLASVAEVYDAYATAIGREYAHVPVETYRVGRAHVLQGFLDRTSIYLTPRLSAMWEAAARGNLAREIGLLRNG